MTIAVVVLVVIAAFLAFAATRPDDFRIARSSRVNASADAVAAHITDFHRWTAWSPWEKLDPTLKRNYSGEPAGKGAVYEWVGNKKVGKGRMEILDASPRNVRIDLQFIEPFAARNLAIFELEPAGDSTNVTWAMEGKRPFMIKVMNVIMPMDKIIGRDFESGLANLKAVAEK